MKALIKKLVETAGPSGYEGPVRELVKAEILPLADEVRVDALGNLIARKGSKSQNGMRIMLAAHMDEIGLMVTYLDDNGFARVAELGTTIRRTLVGGRVQFLNGAMGVIGGEKLENRDKLHEMGQLFVDTGATSKQDSPVKVGDVAVFDRSFLDLGQRVAAKAMDNRANVAVMIEVMRRLTSSPHEVYFVFTSQEEVGERGATTAAFGVDPELAIALDTTPSGDIPRIFSSEIALGKGPAVKVRDSGMIVDPRIVRWMCAAAENAKIPYQLEILKGATTDARAIQLTRGGVPTGCVSIPCRYTHTPSEMIDLNDVQNSIALIVELLSRPVSWS